MDQDLMDDDFSETGVNVGVLLGEKTLKEKNQRNVPNATISFLG